MTDIAIFAVGFLVLVITVCLCLRVGYLLGHQDGYREGLRKGMEFGRLKLMEQKHNDGYGTYD